VHLGIYRFAGDPDELIPAYDRMMASMPPGVVYFHACAVEPHGITIYDACPTREAFERFATGADFQAALAAVGLPEPEIASAPVHNAIATI
jgi:hypothetical protein